MSESAKAKAPQPEVQQEAEIRRRGPAEETARREATDMLDDDQVQQILEKHMLGAIDRSSIQERGRDVFATVELPGGVFVGDQLVKEVVIREMSGKQDMLLMNTEGSTAESLLKMAIGCVESIGDITEPRDVAKILRGPMLIGDFSYLLMRIRQLSVGDKIAFTETCPKCEVQGSYGLFISNLDVYEPVEAVTPQDRRESLDIDKWGTGKPWTFKWHWMTQADSGYLNRLVDYYRAKEEGRTRGHKQARKVKGAMSMMDLIKAGLDPMSAAIIARLDRVLEPPRDIDGKLVRDEVALGRSSKPRDGELSLDQSVKYVRELPTAIRIFLWNQLDTNEPGVDNEVEYQCDSCGHINESVIHPTDPNFFFPTEVDID